MVILFQRMTSPTTHLGPFEEDFPTPKSVGCAGDPLDPVGGSSGGHTLPGYDHHSCCWSLEESPLIYQKRWVSNAYTDQVMRPRILSILFQ